MTKVFFSLRCSILTKSSTWCRPVRARAHTRAHARAHTHTYTGFAWFLTEGKTGEIHEFANETKALRQSWLSAMAQNLEDLEHEELLDSIPVLQITELSALEDDCLTLSSFGMLPSQGDNTDASAPPTPASPGASTSAMRRGASFKRRIKEPPCRSLHGTFDAALADQIERTPSEEEARRSQTLPIGFSSEARRFAHTPGCVFTIKTVPLSIYLSLSLSTSSSLPVHPGHVFTIKTVRLSLPFT